MEKTLTDKEEHFVKCAVLQSINDVTDKLQQLQEMEWRGYTSEGQKTLASMQLQGLRMQLEPLIGAYEKLAESCEVVIRS